MVKTPFLDTTEHLSEWHKDQTACLGRSIYHFGNSENGLLFNLVATKNAATTG
jgi:hypothetical protein